MIANSNGPSPSRPVIFVSRTSAESYAIRSAQVLSRFGTACPIAHVPGAYEPKGGGTCFVVEAIPGPLGESTVRELTPAELTRRQQAGMRAAAESLYDLAWSHDLAASIARKGGAVEALHRRYANEARNEARSIELRLHVAGVRPASALVDDSEPLFSADRDARGAL